MNFITQALSAALPPVMAPAHIRRNPRSFIEATRSVPAPGESARRFGRRAIGRWVMAVAAALALIAVGSVLRGFLSQRSAGSADTVLLAGVVSEHVRARVGERLESTDAGEVKRWIAERVSFGVFVPAFSSAELRGVRVDDIGGRRAIAIEYASGSDLVSYAIVPDTISTRRGSAVGTVETGKRDGFGLAWWIEPGLVHAMVGDVPMSHLRALAEDCIRQAMGSNRTGSESDPFTQRLLGEVPRPQFAASLIP
jgi:anti-sigma factor RsiW